MSWVRQPPVYSPVDPLALAKSGLALLGDRSNRKDRVAELIAQAFNAREVLLADSGTSALVAALRALVPPGGTVAYPGYGCIDLTAAAIRAGVKVRLYDLDPATLSPDLDSVKRTVGRGVDAIVVTHLYGYAADLPAVNEIAATKDIPVIEDAAQAAGGLLNGSRLGALGDVSILSFGRGKGLTAGSGGALLLRGANSFRLATKIRSKLQAGRRGGSELIKLGAQWTLARPALYRLPASIPALRLGEMVYRPAAEPRAISDTAASMLASALAMESGETKRRRVLAGSLLSSIGNAPRVSVIRSIEGGDPGYLRLPLIDRVGDLQPDDALGAIRGYPMTLDQHPQLASILHAGEVSGSGSALLRDRLFTLPTHSRVRASDANRLSEWLGERRLAVPAEAWAT